MAEPKIGELNREITIQALTQTKDAEGGLVDAWENFATGVWAKISNYSGNEKPLVKQGGQAAIARAQFTIFYLEGVLPTMRVVYGGKNYAIKHVNNFNERDRFLILDCETGKNTGH